MTSAMPVTSMAFPSAAAALNFFLAMIILVQVGDYPSVDSPQDVPQLVDCSLHRVYGELERPHHSGRARPVHQPEHPALVLDALNAAVDSVQAEPALLQLDDYIPPGKSFSLATASPPVRRKFKN